MNTQILAALFVLMGKATPAQAQVASGWLESQPIPTSVNAALRQFAHALAATTGRVAVPCPTCDGRGFYRTGATVDGGGRATFCDECNGRGTVHVDVEGV